MKQRVQPTFLTGRFIYFKKIKKIKPFCVGSIYYMCSISKCLTLASSSGNIKKDTVVDNIKVNGQYISLMLIISVSFFSLFPQILLSVTLQPSESYERHYYHVTLYIYLLKVFRSERLHSVLPVICNTIYLHVLW